MLPVIDLSRRASIPTNCRHCDQVREGSIYYILINILLFQINHSVVKVKVWWCQMMTAKMSKWQTVFNCNKHRSTLNILSENQKCSPTKRSLPSLDANGELEKIVFSNGRRDSKMTAPLEKVQLIYKGMKIFNQLIHAKEHAVRIKLQPGKFFKSLGCYMEIWQRALSVFLQQIQNIITT